MNLHAMTLVDPDFGLTSIIRSLEKDFPISLNEDDFDCTTVISDAYKPLTRRICAVLLSRIFQKSTDAVYESLAHFSNCQFMLGRQFLLNALAYDKVFHNWISQIEPGLFA